MTCKQEIPNLRNSSGKTGIRTQDPLLAKPQASTTWLSPLPNKMIDRKQVLNILYQVCVFWADQKTKMAVPASDWQRHFRLFLCNRWMDENWQDASSQHPIPILCFLVGQIAAQCYSTKLWQAVRTQIPLPSVADPKTKRADLATNWLRHFRQLM